MRSWCRCWHTRAMARTNRTALARTIALGALTGMRTFAGPMAVARTHPGRLTAAIAILGGAEMVADKTSLVRNRIEPFPLAARAVVGAVVGGMAAREGRNSVVFGSLLGASAAVAAAHLAYYARTRLTISNLAGGAVEDALVIGLMKAV
jgi:uncharacterized membrane protein